MYCKNCGVVIDDDSKFCFKCGTTVSATQGACVTEQQEIQQEVNENSSLQIFNGVPVDVAEIVDKFNGNKIEAIKYLKALTGLSLSESKKVIDNEYALRKSKNKDKGFLTKAAEQSRQIQAQKLLEKQELKNRVKQMDKDGIAYCPKCYSTSLTSNKKGFGIGKAIIGASVAPIGLVAGNIGAKKIRVTCLKCGHQFWAGKK